MYKKNLFFPEGINFSNNKKVFSIKEIKQILISHGMEENKIKELLKNFFIRIGIRK